MFKVASLAKQLILPVLAGLVVGTFAYAQSTGWSPGPLSGTQAIAYLSNGTTFDPAVNGAGTATRSLRVTMASDSPGLAGGTSKILDSAGTNLATVNSVGQLFNSPEGQKATYGFGMAPAATDGAPTDLFCIKGSATKTVKVLQWQATAIVSATSVLAQASFVKRSAANTGGTSTNPTPTKYDSNSAAATAVLIQYSANPASLGAGTVLQQSTNGVSTTIGSTVNLLNTFGIGGQYLVLRGVLESLCYNHNAQNIVTFQETASLVWTEE